MIIKGKLIKLLAVEFEKSIESTNEVELASEVINLLMRGEYIDFDPEKDLALFELICNIIISNVKLIKMRRKTE